jgi:hypothetical protein
MPIFISAFLELGRLGDEYMAPTAMRVGGNLGKSRENSLCGIVGITR